MANTKKLQVFGSIKGTDGKSAYEYAKDGGYTGTEEEFSNRMATKIPVSFMDLEDNGNIVTGNLTYKVDYTFFDETVTTSDYVAEILGNMFYGVKLSDDFVYNRFCNYDIITYDGEEERYGNYRVSHSSMYGTTYIGDESTLTGVSKYDTGFFEPIIMYVHGAYGSGYYLLFREPYDGVVSIRIDEHELTIDKSNLPSVSYNDLTNLYFYEHLDTIPIVNETRISTKKGVTNVSNIRSDLFEYAKARITINTTSYIMDINSTGGNQFYIGNYSLVNNSYENTGENLCFLVSIAESSGNRSYTLYLDTNVYAINSSVKLSVEGITDIYIEKLPERFLPDTVAKTDHTHSFNDLEDRPFGESGSDVWIYDKTELIFVGESTYTFEVSDEIVELFSTAGNTVYVYWNGTKYECTTQYESGPMWYSVSFDEYFIYREGNTLIFSTGVTSLNGNYEFGLLSSISTIKTIDGKFLPDLPDLPELNEVKYIEQELTEDQQNQARKNIGLYHNYEQEVKKELFVYNTQQNFAIDKDEISTTLNDESGSYIVSFADEIYNVTSDSAATSIPNVGVVSALLWIGNPSLIETSFDLSDKTENLDLPFVVYWKGTDFNELEGTATVKYSSDYPASIAAVIPLTISQVTWTETVYEQIPEEYIPDTIARKEDIPENVLTYSEQSLTEEQIMQARKNLGLYYSEEVTITEDVFSYVYVGWWEVTEDNLSNTSITNKQYLVTLLDNTYEVYGKSRVYRADMVGIMQGLFWIGNPTLIDNVPSNIDISGETDYTDLPFVVYWNKVNVNTGDGEMIGSPTVVLDPSVSTSMMGQGLFIDTVKGEKTVHTPIPKEFIPILYDYIILNSSDESGKQFKITVNDEGTLTATEITD